MIIYPSQVAYLRVVVPPEIESTSDGAGNHHDVMTSEGSSVKLSCKARGLLSLYSIFTKIICNMQQIEILKLYRRKTYSLIQL